MWLLFTLVLSMISVINLGLAQKALMIAPGLSKSQVIFTNQVAGTLQANGIDVTILMVVINKEIGTVKAPNGTKLILVNADPDKKYTKLSQQITNMVFKTNDMDPKMAMTFMDFLAQSVSYVLAEEGLIDRLKKENFDVGFGHMYDYSSPGILHALDIRSTIFLPSGPVADHYYWRLGVPVPWSYVPASIMPLSDRMSFYQRMKNIVGHSAFLFLMTRYFAPQQTAIFRKHYGPDFPDLVDLGAKYQLVLVNSEELLDFPRPIMHKVIYIGGVGMTAPEALNEEWSAEMKKGKKGVILFSLGTVAKPETMPENMRKSFFESFKKFPDYHFIAMFPGDVPEAEGVKNIKIVKWLPQKSLLNHPRMKIFVTHGGYNSVLETALAGVPMVCMPLLGDQAGNMLRVERHGLGVGIDKVKLTEKALYDAITRIITDKSFTNNAKRLSRMIKKKPQSGEERLVKWTKFLAEFKTLDNLRPVSADLTFIEYFMLDAVALISVVILVIFTIFIISCRFMVRKCKGTNKKRSKKKNQ